jgi:DnaK suppressor protein
MPIDTEKFRSLLNQHQKELLRDRGRATAQALEAETGDVEDESDASVADQAKDAGFDESTRDFEELEQVRDALARLDAGTFGKCTICGREIEKARLEAIPWTPYCIDDARAQEPKITPATL